MDFLALVETLPQVMLFIGIAPGVVGLLNWLKARLQGRHGPRAWQPYADLWKLFHRRPVLPETASWVFNSAPLIVFGCFALIGAMVPVVYLPSYDQVLNQTNGPPLADFLVVVALISLARFVTALAGMDSGSPYGGMGSSREMFTHVLSEPVFMMAAYGLALSAYTTSVSGVMSTQARILVSKGPEFLSNFLGHFSDSMFLFISLALTLVMLAEAGRIPFENPATRQELSMAGKAIPLEYGGYHLALLEWSEAMRVTFFMTLLVNLFFPDWLASMQKPITTSVLLILAYPFKLLVMIFLLAIWEETRAKMRRRNVVAPAGLALIFAMIAIVLVYVGHYL